MYLIKKKKEKPSTKAAVSQKHTGVTLGFKVIVAGSSLIQTLKLE